MKVMRLFLMAATLLTAYSAQGAIYSYINSSKVVGPDAIYDWTVQYWDTPDSTPNPCFDPSTERGMEGQNCTVFIGHVHDNLKQAGNLVSDGGEFLDGVQKYKNMGEVGAAFKLKYPLPRSGTQKHTLGSGGVLTIPECVGIFYKTIAKGTSAALGSPMVPGSLCGIVPPPVGQCEFSAAAINLPHGSVQVRDLEGHRARQTAYIRCTQAMSVKVYVTGVAGSGLIDLRGNGSLKSRLTVNGQDGSTGVQMTIPVNVLTPVEFVSTLTTVGTVEGGPFSGSATAILAIP